MTRAFIFSILGYLALTLLGPLQDTLGLDMVVVDIPLIIVVYMAMADRSAGLTRLSSGGRFGSGRPGWAGGITALILGYATDIRGGGVKGIHCFTLVVVFLICRRAARQVYLAGAMSSFLVTFSSSLGASALGLGLLWSMGNRPGLGNITVAVIQAILVAAMAPLVIRLLRMIDLRLMRERTERGSMLSR